MEDSQRLEQRGLGQSKRFPEPRGCSSVSVVGLEAAPLLRSWTCCGVELVTDLSPVHACSKQNGQPGVGRGTEQARGLAVGLSAPFGPCCIPASSLPVLVWGEGAEHVSCLIQLISKGGRAQPPRRDCDGANVDGSVVPEGKVGAAFQGILPSEEAFSGSQALPTLLSVLPFPTASCCLLCMVPA